MDDKRLDLNLLLALESLLAELNVTRAARRLNLSQPALSVQLSRLRTIFGDQLLIPSSRGMLPTAMALEMTFSVAASDYMQVAILLPFLLRSNRTAPGLRVMVRLLDIRVTAAELQKGEVDVAFVQTGDVQGKDLRSLDVLTERYIGIARKGSVEKDAMSLDRFMKSKHIIGSVPR